MALEYVTAGLDARHKAALDEMCERRRASKTAVIRQAIRILAMTEHMASQGKTLSWVNDEGAGMLLFGEMLIAEENFKREAEERANGQHVQAGIPAADDAGANAGRGDEEQGRAADDSAQGSEAQPGE